MKICPSCGEENPDRFPLCGFCGTAFEATPPPREVRKSVTVVFSDLRGSTSLAEALDSESLREVMSRYFDEMRDVLESHGGLIEKYIGDAVMAVFGLPTAHEDDALRAVRAAHAMTLALATLNEELERRWGVRLANRTGVNTGEVVAGDPTAGQRLVTGDAVNVAARLEQAAPANEVLIGEPTYRLVRDAVEVETLEPLELKGKSEPMPAYRLLSVADVGAMPRRHDLPLVGRESELSVLSGALESALSGSCRLVTLLGDAGVGKSRLIAELGNLARRKGTTIVHGRCLPYGRGITFWPMVEIVRELAGIEERDTPRVAVSKIASLASDDEIADRVAAMLGLTETQYPLDELYWASRKLFDHVARDRPLVAVFEDVHWAEPALLDLVERTLAYADDVPLLLLCSARPDLKELRAGWGQLRGATEIELAPLSADATTRVIEHRLGSTDIPHEVREQIVESAEGNPLFVEQLIAMLIDDGALRQEEDGRWIATARLSEAQSIPPTIEALLAARLDLLSPVQISVLEAAAVIGTVFPRAALDQLVPESVKPAVSAELLELSDKHFVSPVAGETGDAPADGDGSMRFQHVLIREAAYNRLLKRARADLHERFADWAEAVNRDREREPEYAEIVGYHLEQASRYLGELAPVDEHGRSLATRAASHLGPAGRRAFRRGDMGAAANLLRRAVTMLSEGTTERLELLPELAEALMEIGEFASAELCVEEAVTQATAQGDETLGADAVLTRLLVRHRTTGDLDGWRAEVEREANRVIELLGSDTAPAVLAKAWRMIGFVYGTVCAWGATALAEEQAIEHARQAGDVRQEARLSAAYVMALTDGPTPTSEALARAEEIVERGLADGQAEAVVLLSLASLHGMRGEFALARELTSQAAALLRDRGAVVLSSHTSLTSARFELLAGDPVAAEAQLRRDYEELAALDERYFRPLVAALLARTLVELGRLEEAEAMSREASELAAPDDVEAQAVMRTVTAQLRSLRGFHDEAEVLAREALELVRSVDAPVLEADILLEFAAVLVRAGRVEEGESALEEALRLYERKEHLAGAARARERATVEV